MDKIQHDSTEYIVACAARGRIFSEHKTGKAAQKKMKKYPCLDADYYCIYSRRDWIEVVYHR